MKLLDTNKIIQLVVSKDRILEDPETYAISRITYIEVLAWTRLNEKEIGQLQDLMEHCFTIFEINADTSDFIAEYKREYGISLGDSIIIATALYNDLELVTLDKRLLKKYHGIKAKLSN